MVGRLGTQDQVLRSVAPPPSVRLTSEFTSVISVQITTLVPRRGPRAAFTRPDLPFRFGDPPGFPSERDASLLAA